MGAEADIAWVMVLALVVVARNSQAYPQFEFGNEVLPNNSHLFHGRIGEGVNNSLRCVTDYSDCCNGSGSGCCSGSGSGMGNWYDEQGMEVHQGAGGDSDLYVTRGSRVVYLNRRTGVQSGMWRCDIPDSTGTTQSIYIYTGTGLSNLSVTVTGSGSTAAGSSYTLTCRVTLSIRASGSSVFVQWQGPGPSTAGPTEDRDTVVSSQLTLDPLTLAHGGDHTCTATYTVDGQIASGNGTKATKIIIPTPSVTLRLGDGVDERVLVGEDAVLYCDIQLIGVTRGRDVTVDVTWSRDSVPITHSTRVITSAPAGDGATLQSTVTFTPVLISDSATYVCDVTVTPLQGVSNPITTYNQSLSLAIREPVHPILPDRVMVTDISADSAMIWWTVSYIAYSPEMYVVKYGTSQDSLTENSDSTHSGEDTTIINKTYSIKLSNLKESTTYYVQVVATNTANRTNMSNVETFTTLPLMEMESDQSTEGEGTGFPVGVAVAIVVFAVIGAAVAVCVVLFVRYKRQREKVFSVHKKYSIEGQNAGRSVNDDTQSEKAECTEKAVETGMETLQVEAGSYLDTVEEEAVDEYYFQDSATIVPRISSIPIEEFPKYVQDMVQNKGNKMKAEFMALSQLPQPPCTVAALQQNAPHNRFNNIHPFDKSRVCLTETPGVEGSDYINASFIDGYDGQKNAYIAAQGPVEESVERFWSMVWQYKLHTIVMLTECVEAGRVKCVRYWSEKLHNSLTLGSKFCVTYTSTQVYAEFEIRKFKLENLVEADSRPMTITQLHYTAWPDHGVPDNVMSLIGFICHVRKVHPVSQQQPLLVHCSAGVGRTGTLILLDIIMQQMKAEGSISVLQCLRKMRMQRMNMVQSQQQYEFIHCGLRELVVCGETEVAAANLRLTINNLEKMMDGGTTGFQKQLKILDEVCSQQPVSCADAEKEYNSSKNRFPDKLPNDTHRIRLRSGPLPGSDYINASLMNGYKLRGAFIATQGPLKNTVVDFWRMINEFQCGCIVMLCELQEDGQESSYCFWPKEEGDSEVHGKLTVKLLSVKTDCDIVIRKLEVVEGAVYLSRPHRVTVLQLTSWPVKGLPHPTAVISLIDHLTNTQMRSSTRRTVVICSDGVRRTGTFLTIHSQVERLKTEGVVDFLQSIKSARLQRAGLVLDADHYAFCHEVLNTYLDNFDTYSNFKEVL